MVRQGTGPVKLYGTCPRCGREIITGFGKETTASQILEAIRRHSAEHGYPPTIRDIQESLNISSTSTVVYHMRKLRDRGLIIMRPGHARTVRVVDICTCAAHNEDASS